MGESLGSISKGLRPVETKILWPLAFASRIALRALSGRPFPKGSKVPSTSKKKFKRSMARFYSFVPLNYNLISIANGREGWYYDRAIEST